MKTFWIAMAFCLLTPFYGAQAAPDLKTLYADASKYWAAQDYKQYAATCKAIEKEAKSFAAAKNVALGLHLMGDHDGALRKIDSIKRDYQLTSEQAQRLAAMRAEAREYSARIQKVAIADARKASLKVTLPKAPPSGKRSSVSKDTPSSESELSSRAATSGGRYVPSDCPQERSGRCLGLKPEHAEEFVKAQNVRTMRALGYQVHEKVEGSTLQPEVAPPDEKKMP